MRRIKVTPEPQPESLTPGQALGSIAFVATGLFILIKVQDRAHRKEAEARGY